VQPPVFVPAVASAGTVTTRENVFPPASNNGAFAPRCAQLRSHDTARPVLSGFVPGATAALIVKSVPGEPLSGFVLTAIAGGQGFVAARWLRGVGAAAEKSEPFSSLSVQPPLARRAAVVFEIVGVGPAPSKQFVPVPYPARSIVAGSVGQDVPDEINVLSLRRTTLPAPLAIGIVPVASGGGRAGAEVFAPTASWTRK
jgi:hypothetical protein